MKYKALIMSVEALIPSKLSLMKPSPSVRFQPLEVCKSLLTLLSSQDLAWSSIVLHQTRLSALLFLDMLWSVRVDNGGAWYVYTLSPLLSVACS